MRKNVRSIHPLTKGVILFALVTDVGVILTIAWSIFNYNSHNEIEYAIHHSAAVCPQNIMEPQCFGFQWVISLWGLVRMQTQGLAAGLLNQSPCEQNLEICIFNWLSRRFFYQLVYEKKVKVKLLGHVQLFATPWTVAYQAPQSMEFSRQEYWSGLPFPSPR